MQDPKLIVRIADLKDLGQDLIIARKALDPLEFPKANRALEVAMQRYAAIIANSHDATEEFHRGLSKVIGK